MSGGARVVSAPEIAKWQYIEERARGVLDAFCFSELRVPLLEPAVGGAGLVLRKEALRSVARAFVATAPAGAAAVTRWYLLGPSLGADGGERQEIAAAAFSAAGGAAEAEIVGLLVGLFGELGLEPGALEVELDAEEPEGLKQIGERQGLLATLGVNAVHRSGLAASMRAPGLVDGVVFAVRTGDGRLLASGGRCDRLLAALGARGIPGVGFHVDLGQLFLALDEPPESFVAHPALLLAPLDEGARAWALPCAQRLRVAGIRVALEHRPVTKAEALAEAARLGARLALLVDAPTLATGRLPLEDLAKRQRHEIAEDDLPFKVQALLD